MSANHENLCTKCGLCCDGTLFADVELATAREAFKAESMGLEIEESDDNVRAVLIQPCAALKNRRCTIYPFRPKCCRTFECSLLQQLKRGWISFDEADGRISEVIEKIKEAKQKSNNADRKKALEIVNDLVEKTFLANPTRDFQA